MSDNVRLGFGGEDAVLRATGTKTAAYNAQYGDCVVVSTAGGAVTVTLPASDRRGLVAVRLLAGTAAVTVDGYSAETVDGAANAQVVFTGETRIFASDGLGAWTTMASGGSTAGLSAILQPVVGAVNTVAASGATQTIPEPNVYKKNDITLTASCTLTLPATTKGKSLEIVFRQGGSGSYTVTWPAGTKFPGGSLTITAALNSVDLVKVTSVVEGTWIAYRVGAAIA
jgi:hypothetical protein